MQVKKLVMESLFDDVLEGNSISLSIENKIRLQAIVEEYHPVMDIDLDKIPMELNVVVVVVGTVEVLE